MGTESTSKAGLSPRAHVVTRIVLALCTVVLAAAQARAQDGYVQRGKTFLYYKVIGSGEPLVVLHGGPGFDHRQFLPFINVLAAHHKVILFDQRGTGLSSGPVDAASITIDDFLEDVDAVRRAFGIEKMNLLGHSWGGVLAMYYAIRHPDRLKSLILCSTTASIDGFDAMRSAIVRARKPEDSARLEEIEATEAFARNDPRAVERYWRVYFKPYFPDPAMVWVMDLTFTKNTLEHSSAVARYVLDSVGRFDLRSELGRIRVPTLILHGDADLLPVTYAKQIQVGIPHAELVVLRNSGHWIFIDATEAFKSSIETFLARIPSGG